MKLKIILCLALAISLWCRAGDNTNVVQVYDKYPGVGDVPKIDINMPGLNDPILLVEQPTSFGVTMIVGGGWIKEKHQTPTASQLRRQVWLLQADGTSIPQAGKPILFGFSHGGYLTDHVIFLFEKKMTNEIAGIVVSVDGRLYCHEIEKDQSKP